jgi:hypothetical protein
MPGKSVARLSMYVRSMKSVINHAMADGILLKTLTTLWVIKINTYIRYQPVEI